MSSFESAKKPCDAKGPEQPEKETFKNKLDRVATEARSHAHGSNEQPNPVVEKVKEYIPGVEKLLGSQEEQKREATQKVPDGPPERPHHDEHIEEFVRDQHRSKRDDGLLEG